MQKNEVMKNYRFLAILIGAMILGCVAGWVAPGFAAASSRIFLSSKVTYRLSGKVFWANVDFPLCRGPVIPTTGNCEAKRSSVSFAALLIIRPPEILKFQPLII